MQIRFDAMKVLVTGGAGGIGLETARVLRDAGGDVWVVDRAVVEEPGVSSRAVDLTAEGAIEGVIAEMGRVDVAVLNAGIARVAKLEATTREMWDATIGVNLTAVFVHLKALAMRMREQRSGAIVLTASTNSFDGEAELIAYNASKAGLMGILHTAANELGPWGIRVNAVCPGLIETRLTAEAFANEEVIRPYFAALPLGRGGQPREVAKAIAFLASEQASFITGTTLTVDGGQMATKFGTWAGLDAEFRDKQWRLR